MTRLLVGELVEQRSEHLATAERRVARSLLAAYPVAGLETMLELAFRASVNVLRFVNKLGFEGYLDFRRQLHDEIQ